jgi:hypothetical protein
MPTHRVNPPLPALGTAAYAITLAGVCDAGIWNTTFDYIMSSNVVQPSSENNISVSFIATNQGNFLACLSDDYFLQSVKVASLTGPTRIPHVTTLNSPGTVAQHALPSFVSGKLLKQTLTKGQHGRGRNLMPGVPVTFVNATVNAENLTAAAIVIYNSFWAGLMGPGVVDGAVTGSIALVTRPVVAGTPATLGQVLNSMSTAALLSTCRRRRLGVGR